MANIHPNQDVVINTIDLFKVEPQIARDLFAAASKDLGKSSFNVWCYLALNQKGYEFAFSPKALETHWGVSDRSVTNAKKELIEKKYLVKKGEHVYEFFARPQSKWDF